MTKKLLQYGELFCGPGGLALGAINSKLRHKNVIYEINHAWANDFDKDSCDTYANNICPKNKDSVVCQDVSKLNMKNLPPIDILTFGFPCNDFSIVGEQKGFSGKYGGLYSYGVKAIEQFRPKFFVAENVGGIKSANEGNSFKVILKELSEAGEGYNLSVHLYKAEEYGIAQMRHRVIIVGIIKSLKLKFNVPTPTTVNNYFTVKEALTNPKIPIDAPNQELTNQSAIVIERLRLTKPGENAWTAKLPKYLQLNVKKARLSHIYKRLHPDKPSYTITGSGGGGTHVYHWKENRALTNRERARIQTFPDYYKFYGSKERVRKQIGMAVPPKLSQQIFESLLKIYAGKEYPSVPNGNLSHLIQEELIFSNTE